MVSNPLNKMYSRWMNKSEIKGLSPHLLDKIYNSSQISARQTNARQNKTINHGLLENTLQKLESEYINKNKNPLDFKPDLQIDQSVLDNIDLQTQGEIEKIVPDYRYLKNGDSVLQSVLSASRYYDDPNNRKMGWK